MTKPSGKYLVLPYIDQKLDFWEKVIDLGGERIREVYFPITDGRISTGRP